MLVCRKPNGELYKPEIEPEDVKKLYSSFDLNSPTGLLEKVWFDIHGLLIYILIYILIYTNIYINIY